MKKVFLAAFVVVMVVFSAAAQKKSHGFTAGYQTLKFKSSEDDVSISVEGSGYALGIFTDIPIAEKFSVQPELQYASTSEDGESINQIIVPVMFKYWPSERVNIQAGPQIDFGLSDWPSNFKDVGLGFALGLGVDVSDYVFLAVRYSLGLFDRGDDAIDLSGVDLKTNQFHIGMGYRF
jgi:hypothetical protein